MNINIDFKDEIVELELINGETLKIQQWGENSLKISGARLQLSGYNCKARYHQEDIGTFRNLIVGRKEGDGDER